MIQHDDRKDGVFVNRMTYGQKYLFTSISIPSAWLSSSSPAEPVDLARLLNQWHEAWLREQREREAKPCGV